MYLRENRKVKGHHQKHNTVKLTCPAAQSAETKKANSKAATTQRKEQRSGKCANGAERV